MISLTAHYGADDCKPRVLQISPFEGSHTGQAIGDKLSSLLEDWNIPISKVHAIVSDNGANVKAGLRLADLPGVGCTIHTLQLVVQKALKGQRTIIDLLSRCRRIAGHFKHSSLANDKLKIIQQTYNVVQHMIYQDVSTRWDSTYTMIERILEQKRALVAYDSEYGLPDHLSANEWSLIGKLVAMLEPFQRTTKDFSRAASSISQVIPFIMILKSELQQVPGSEGILTTKEAMCEDLQSRFTYVQSSTLHYVATFLDPRFKDRFLDATTTAAAKDNLEELCAVVRIEDEDKSVPHDNASATEASDPTLDIVDGTEEVRNAADDPTTPKRQKFNIWEKVTATVGEHEKTIYANSADPPVREEITRYLSEPAVQLDQNTPPYSWWKSDEIRHRFPLLFPVAVKFLSCPPSSVASESIFSVTGYIDSDRRKRLLSEHIEVLGFIKSNSDLC